MRNYYPKISLLQNDQLLQKNYKEITKEFIISYLMNCYLHHFDVYYLIVQKMVKMVANLLAYMHNLMKIEEIANHL